ncbi:MAG: ATP-dependent zinc metalloprotease FtsH [Halieaceae bacterium]|jgi:cell division protease FtsH|nr:ATP-dependent zinc metalloprotease FtsH [Halieaceae bacterium]
MDKKDKPESNRHNPWLMPLWLMGFAIYYLVTYVLPDAPRELAYSEFVQQVEETRIHTIVLKGRDIQGRYQPPDSENTRGRNYDFHVVIPELEGERLLDLLQRHQVVVEVRADRPPLWLQILSGFLPWLLIIGFFVWTSRALRQRMEGMGGTGGVYGFGRSRARRHPAAESGTGFKDVAGLESAKEDLMEIVDYLKDPTRYREFGANLPKGVLMMGAPGTGKTLLARACAGEAGVPFYSVSGSEFIEMFVGVGASRVRDMFRDARREAPALIFIDEIDSVGRVRGTGLGGGNDEREQTLNQILAEMDGFEPEEAVVVLAATNRPDVLDPALLRPGRFDRKVTLDLPQRKARSEILALHCRNKPLGDDVDLDEVAAITVGFSGADLANIVNEAALLAVHNHHQSICKQDFLSSRDKVLMGAPRADLLNPSERERIACHEAGHAIAAWFSPHSDSLEKVSIVPRGRSLGVTEQIPSEDRHNVTEDFLRARLAILLAGRCAEKLRFDSYSTGAEDDLKQATKMAYKMVGQWGMTESVGAVGYSISEEHPFLGRDITEPREFGEETARLLDRAVRQTLKDAEDNVRQLLLDHQRSLERLVDALLEHETLYHDELLELLKVESPVE